MVVMGVCGCGKSEVGRRLADRAGYRYVEGDDYHAATSVAKMAAGAPLDDADRADWLLTLQAKIAQAAENSEGCVLSCSALKRRYRDVLRVGDSALVFLHLDGSPEVILSRMSARKDHFMPATLVESQFNDLERLGADEVGMELDIRMEPDQLVDKVMQGLALPARRG
jgi:carbohydrate kinase (thermoresistant glucokinase family)